MLILLIIGITIVGALFTIKRKTTTTLLLIGYYASISIAIFLAFIPFCQSNSINFPFVIFFSITSGGFLTLFAFHFPTLQHPQGARITAMFLPGIAVLILLFSMFYEMRFFINGSIPSPYYSFILSCLPIYNLAVVIVVIYQCLVKRLKSKSLIIIAMLTSIIPSVIPLIDHLNLLHKSLIDILFFVALTITELFVFLAFLNHAEDTIRLNVKYQCITLCIFLLVFGMASLIITNWFETEMENAQFVKTSTIMETLKQGELANNHPPDIVYIFSYSAPFDENQALPTLEYTREDTIDPYMFAASYVVGPMEQPLLFTCDTRSDRNRFSSQITKVCYYEMNARFTEPSYLGYRFFHDERLYEVGFSYQDNAANLHWISIRLMVLIVVSSLLIELLLAFILNTYLIKPIRSILTSIKLVNQNQLLELPIYAEDEIGLLTHAFNDLVKNLRETSASLTSANQFLEVRVEERTKDLEMLRTITTTLNEAMTLENALQSGLRTIMHLFDCKTGWILLLDAYQTPHLIAAENMSVQEKMLDPAYNLQTCQCIHALKREKWRRAEMMHECSLYKPHVSIPLRIGEKPLGTVNLIFSPQKTITDNEYQLLFTIGEAFSAAIDRGRLFDAERKQRDLAETLMEVGSILSSTLDIDQVIKEILNQVSRLVPYDSANVMLVQNGQAHITQARGYDQFGEKVFSTTQTMVFDIKDTPNLRRMAETGKPWFISDIRSNPGWLAYPGTEHIRSWVGAPIVVHGEVIAFFSLDKTEPNFYTYEHADRLAIFAAQAGLAMENARLYSHSQEDLTREQRFHRITQSLTHTFDLPKMLQNSITQTVGLLDTDAGEFGLLSDDKTQLKFDYSYTAPSISMPELNRSLSLSDPDIAWDVISQHRPIMLDLTKQPKAAPHLAKSGIASAIFAPIISGDIPLGIIEIFSLKTNRQFTNRDLALVESIGRQVGIAFENAHLFREVQKLAISDPLTGIFNRGHFFTQGFLEMERTSRYRHHLSVIMIDLDQFKKVNDNYGHATGDQILKKVTQRFNDYLRKVDILGRYGGDELAIILPETDLSAALQVAERLRSSISDQPFVIDEKNSVSLTISLGVATYFPEKAKSKYAMENFENMLEEADAALYQAKNDGRNLVRPYSGPAKKRSNRGKIPPVNGTRT